jgi:undecaprenyl-phosphate galactose phosphotransferase/putative colanic acid biosynthesis UDP-glucose lipid carrier transferase
MTIASESDFRAHQAPTDFTDADQQSAFLQLPIVVIEFVSAAADALAIVLASLMGFVSYQLLVSDQLLSLSAKLWNIQFHLGAGVAGATLYGLFRVSLGSYQIGEILNSKREGITIISLWSLTLLVLASLAFILKVGDQFSRGAMVFFALFGFAFLAISKVAMRVGIGSALKQGRMQGRRVVLFGLQDELLATRRTDILMAFGMTEIGRVAVPVGAAWTLAQNSEIEALLDRVMALSRDNNVKEIVLALAWDDTQKIDLVRQYFHLCPLPLRLLPDRRVRYLAGNGGELKRGLSLEIKGASLSAFDRALKRALDLTVAFAALVSLAPLMLITALAIKLDSPGPIFFRQQRTGYNSMPFSILKFRTMKVMENGGDVVQATRADPRVTRIGRWLRRTSLDELPQLLNVIRGDMSLVGPRPHAVVHDYLYGKQLWQYAYRHHVKPGITGWAQINGCRGETPKLEDMERRLELDLWYIDNWCLRRDLAILLMTAITVVFSRNVY